MRRGIFVNKRSETHCHFYIKSPFHIVLNKGVENCIGKYDCRSLLIYSVSKIKQMFYKKSWECPFTVEKFS